MIIKQVTVTVENKEGKLKEVMDILADANVNVEAISMADTVDRLIVPDPEETMDLLKERGYEVELVDVIRVKVPSQAGALASMLVSIAEAKINLEYMYSMASEPGIIILKPSDVARAEELIAQWEK